MPSDDGDYEWGDYLRTQQSDLYAPGWSEPVYTERKRGCKAAIVSFGVLFIVCGITFVVRIFILPSEPAFGKADPLAIDKRSKSLMRYFKSISGRGVYKEGNGSFSAASWIILQDDFQLQVDSSHLQQRYVLALLYFSMSHGSANWLDGETHECNWEVVRCNSDKMVTTLELDASQLVGSLPSEIGLLTSLQTLNLRDNEITGMVPSSWDQLIALENLFIDGNDMEGSIPDFFCSSLNIKSIEADCEGELHQVDCSCCDNCIPIEQNPTENVVPAESIKENDDGDTDDEIMNFSEEEEDNVIDEEIMKVIEEEEEMESNLSERSENKPKESATETEEVNYPIYSSSTDMIYRISEFSPQVGNPGTPQEEAYEWLVSDGNLSINADSLNLIQRYVLALLYLDLGGEYWPFKEWLMKDKLECKFPGIGCNDNSEVISITLVSSGLKGSLPSEIAALTSLEVLDLSDNDITGNIPSSLEALTGMKSLHLQHNNLGGSVSPEICRIIAEVKVDCDRVACSCCGC